MKDYIFDDCVEQVEKYSGRNVTFWPQLAEKYNYEDKEAIRSSYRREARKRGYKLNNTQRSKDGPKILIFDLENTPMLGYFWNLWPQSISIESIVRDWHLLSYAAKWLFDDEVISDVLTPKEIRKEDDSRIIKGIWNLLDQADIAVAYNGISFDFKRCNTRFLKNGLLPPSYYVSVDPLIVAKRVFDISSNKMAYIAEFIDGDRKIHADYSLWVRCMNGDEDALEEMKNYNMQDVVVLETIYLNFLPWMGGNHPNMNVFYTDNVNRCPICGSENIVFGDKKYPTLTNLYQAFECQSCGYRGRDRKGLLSKEKRATIVR